MNSEDMQAFDDAYSKKQARFNEKGNPKFVGANRVFAIPDKLVEKSQS